MAIAQLCEMATHLGPALLKTGEPIDTNGVCEMLERLPHIEKRPISISWNGKRLVGNQGDSVAAALYAQGIRAFTKSRKFHTARGLSGSFSAGHVACVNGLPHCRLDQTPAKDGDHVEMENVWPSPRFDMMNAARLLPRKMVRAGFEHPKIIPDGTWAWSLWEKFLWNMAGEADPPAARNAPLDTAREIEADTLVIGAGPAGVKAAQNATGSVVLISRSAQPLPSLTDGKHPALPPNVVVLRGHEVYGVFDNARLVAAAPTNPFEPAVLIKPKNIVFATGARSVPPLVCGAALPGVLEARAALEMAELYGVPPGRRTVVIGTQRGQGVAQKLAELGCNIVEFFDVAQVERIAGSKSVKALYAQGRKIACDSVVHAGPWRADPSLPFQASADGFTRLLAGDLPEHVSLAGACCEASELVSFGRALSRDALVCPCMDVTVDEVLDLIASGVTHIEELKRRTTCGMGLCQGVPCWDYLAAVIADATGQSLSAIGHPTYRPPRSALTIGQAAGMADITEVEA